MKLTRLKNVNITIYMKILVRYFMLLVMTLSLSMSFSRVSTAEVMTDYLAHELPHSSENESSEDVELEIEFHETPPMIMDRPFQMLTVTISQDIFHSSPSYLDSYHASIDIPPLS